MSGVRRRNDYGELLFSVRERREGIGKKTHTGTATTNSGRKKMEGIYEIFQ